MNPVLAYAIEHQARARAILVSRYGVPRDDVEDVAQDLLIRILRADPTGSARGNRFKPAGYWSMALRSTAIDFHRRRNHRNVVPLTDDRGDPRQDPQAVAFCRDEMRKAWVMATPTQRQAIRTLLTKPGPLPPGMKGALCRLRRKLRARQMVAA